MRRGLLALSLLSLLWWPLPGGGATAHPLPASALQARIDAAPVGATVAVEGGTYLGPIHIDKPVHLVGKGWPVLDGGGQGTVVTITADGASISGFVIRGTGWNPSQEPAAVKVDRAKGVTISGNRIRDAFFGIYLIDADGALVEGNDLRLAPDVDVLRRGHGVYLWEVSGATLVGNTIRYSADGFYLDHADDNRIANNVVEHGRYGVHLMYSHDVEVVGNVLKGNLAGVVDMFSHRLLLQDNDILDNRGATGIGVLVKDSDDLFAVGNRIVGNVYGMTADNSPQSVGATVIFQRNLVAFNRVGAGLLPNAPATLFENAFVDNGIQVQALGTGIRMRLMHTHGGHTHGGGMGMAHRTSGGEEPASLPQGMALTSGGRGNYWSDYRGYDLDGDGVGDVPYRLTSLFTRLLRRRPLATAFVYTLAQQALGVAERLFPAMGPGEELEDAAPLMEPPVAVVGRGGKGPALSLLLTSLAMAAVPVYVMVALRFPAWRRRHALGAGAD